MAKIGTVSAEGGPTQDPNFGHDLFFLILKNSHQDLYNEGSNFILSSLEVGHFGLNQQQSQNRARF